MNCKEITSGVYYTGVNDRTTELFESLWPLPLGVTYNTYIVKGAMHTALIDGVEIGECDKLRENIEAILGPGKAPQYLVINHMEPDHSGAIRVIRSFYPDITIVGNAKTLDMVKGFYGIDTNVMKVADGDSIDLGDITLVFRLTPMVHWPETMMTYVPERKLLFSGDGFGCFGALNGGVIDMEMDVEPYFPEMVRYYACIVGKYGMFVQKALAKLEALDVEYICSTHGPVWHEEASRVIDMYARMSRYDAETGVVIVYGSMYGNTAEMAEIIACRLAERGIRKIRIYDAARADLSLILRDVFELRGLIIGSATYNNTLFPPVETVVQAIKTREIKNRVVATFGSFTWASQALKRINQVLGEAKLLTDDMISVEMKQSVHETTIDDCRALADAVADRLYDCDK